MKRSDHRIPRNMSNTYLINRPADFRFTQLYLMTMEFFETIYLEKLTVESKKSLQKKLLPSFHIYKVFNKLNNFCILATFQFKRVRSS